jgi:CspA family cold shock protein
MTGVVVRWGPLGFGTIRSDDGEEVYVHATNVCRPGDRDLAEGERVEFRIARTRRGPRREALNVTPLPTSQRRFDP